MSEKKKDNTDSVKDSERVVDKAYSIEDAIAKIRKEKKKKFVQSFDLAVSLKNIDMKKPEGKISKEAVLPHGPGKEIAVGFISDSGDITKDDVEKMAKDKKMRKEILGKYEFFVAEAPLMPLVGKVLGRYLAPAGRMPKPIPPKIDAQPIIDMAKKTVRIRIKDTPNIHCIIGKENMKDDELKDNAEFLIKEIKSALPKGVDQIKNVFIKTTMGKPLKLKFR